MEYLKLEGTDMKTSEIGLGTWAIGGWMWGGTEEKSAIDTIHAALDKGINLIDTAPVYGFGTSEKIAGKALKQASLPRDQIVLATKVALDWKDEQVFRNASEKRINQEIEDSLKRLQTDYIDLYQVHWPDYSTSLEETAKALQKLKDEGKIRAIGVSNFDVEQIKEFRKYADLSAVQPPYNLFEREIEKDLLPYCKENNLTTLLYSSLCRGLLTGKMKPDSKWVGDDLRNVDPKYQSPRYEQYLYAVQQLDDYARKHHGKQVIHLAIRWILQQPGANIPLWGGRKPGQMDALGEIDGWKLTQEDMKAIDNILKETIKDPVGPEFMAPPK
jgi:aryl-alcohol dehydrogenase-like predicted oxidoreductase